MLRRHGLLPSGIGYRDWMSTVGKLTAVGRVVQDPRSEGTEAARLRRSIEDYLLAYPDREPRILSDLRESCHSVGIKIADGPEGVDALAEILDNPWSRPVVSYAAGIQVLKLSGPLSRETMAFAEGAADADLFDLGPDEVGFAPAMPRWPAI